MIKIDRARIAEPLVLADPNATGQERWNHPTVREALSKMQYGKCCYCEKKIETSGHGQAVDHYKPQGVDQYAHLENIWTNLLHACSNCNGAKWKKFPILDDGTPALIDPSDPATDPEDHIDFDVDDEEDATFARAKPKDNSRLGDETIKVIKLDTTGQRHARATAYRELLNAYGGIVAADQTTKDAKIRALRALLGADHQYAAFARAFAREKNLSDRFEMSIPSGATRGD